MALVYSHLKKGKISVSEKGFGFVVLDNEEDIHVEEGRLNGAINGDLVIVERRNTARNGEIVVAMTEDNEVTLKTFYKEDGHFRLQPENDTMAPIILDKVYIVGKAIGLYRKL